MLYIGHYYFTSTKFEQHYGVEVRKRQIIIPVTQGPVKAVAYGYMRGGSTFFGELFNLNPNAFYLYEILDSLSSHMYGFTPWSIGEIIATTDEKIVRKFTSYEKTAMTDHLDKVRKASNYKLHHLTTA